ncbi:MAG: hypothetical protein AAFN93_18460 [Bacteroidota bacterium]
MKNLMCFTLLICVLSGCGHSDTIIFSSGRAGNSDIYMMGDNGENVIRLTNSPKEEWAPTVLNENEITFLREEEDGIKRYKLNMLTREQMQINHPNACLLDDKNVLYAPLSKRQLFQCDGNIYLADYNGNNELNLTKGLEGRSFKASWFPDEESILFTNTYDGNKELYSIKPDGSSLNNITNHPGNDEAGMVSPSGKYVVFSSDRDGSNNQELYILNLETNDLRNITNTPDWELIGRWSSDGNRIYFGSNKDGNWELYSYDLISESTKRLTNNDSFDGDPRILRR